MKTPSANDIRKSWENQALALTKEKRQAFLDLLWAGKTLGEAREETGISFEAAIGITNLNISDMKFLNRETL